MPRYAVLRDVTDPEIHPIGLLVEQPGMVKLLLARDCGIRTNYDEPYTVHEPDGAEVVYRPGENEYFDHVVLSLSRTFMVEEVVSVPRALDDIDIKWIYLDRVARPHTTRRPYAEREAAEAPALAGAYVSAHAPANSGNHVTRAAQHELGRAA